MSSRVKKMNYTFYSGVNNVIVAGIECESNNSDEIFSPKCSPCQDDLLLWKGSCVKGEKPAVKIIHFRFSNTKKA